ncbi:beta-mannosidase [Nilaparvata lugens]|uniref:beta-mannosidase n=1 Tax=Nilaparvata lugens TaxID=108931 RepID=UPI00193C8D81|nr:beta-mannosidase [Nilaparvata lugens]
MRMNYLVSAFASALFLQFICGYNCDDMNKAIFISLDSERWTVSNSSSSVKLNAIVPGGIYTDLKNAYILKENFFYKNNDIEYRWVGREDWSYVTSFQVGHDVMQKNSVWIVFHGLDTIAEIFLNNFSLGKANNMFVRYRFDVKNHLKTGDNTLEVKFASPIRAALDLSSHSNYSIPPECPDAVQSGECHINFLRKMQASFSWDWGPAFPSVGIWKSVEVEAFNSALIRSTSISTTNTSSGWVVSGRVHLDGAPGADMRGTADVSLSGLTPSVSSHVPVHVVFDANGYAFFDFNPLHVQRDLVKLWWPNGYGDQNLYLLNVTLNANNEANSMLTRFGFRTARLVQDPIDKQRYSKGLTFYFEINGIKIFAKGSNYIPAHILPELSSDEATLRNLLGAAKDTHMNMLRVWGGGLYESELFYKLCDEMGIMIWQDMMFACAMYPTNDEFINSVSTEIVQQVRRLQSHPSIVVWAGNNENEAALTGNWYHTLKGRKRYSLDYVELYVRTIKRLVEENDGTRSYVVSSPSNGLESEREGYLSNNPYNPLYGDVHVYNYLADNWDITNVGPTRFSSEYGIQSLPSYTTLKQVIPEHDLIPFSKLINSRQHHRAGYVQIEEEINMNLPNFNRSDIHQWIYFSQINQAMSMKTLTERYRQMRDSVDSNGYGLTMGALYWQLNDVWQAPSWSSLEFGGKWKMLHYFAEKFFSPILVSPWIEYDDRVKAMVISDRHQLPPLQVQLLVVVYRWDQFSPVNTFVTKATIVCIISIRSKFGGKWKMLHYFAEKFFSPILVSPWIEYDDRVKAMVISDRHQLPPLQVQLLVVVYRWDQFNPVNTFVTKATIKLLFKFTFQVKNIRPHSDSSSQFEITITSDQIALFVWLDAGTIKGRFSDNGFQMTSREKKVTFMSWQPLSENELAKVLTISTVKGHQLITGNDATSSNAGTDLPAHLVAPSKASILSGISVIVLFILNIVL